jgi:hypothetical protein
MHTFLAKFSDESNAVAPGDNHLSLESYKETGDKLSEQMKLNTPVTLSLKRYLLLMKMTRNFQSRFGCGEKYLPFPETNPVGPTRNMSLTAVSSVLN